MLLLAIAWFLIASSCALGGHGVLALMPGVRGLPVEERLILSTWLGIALVAVVLLGFSLVVPIGPAVGGAGALNGRDPDRNL